MAKPTLSVPVSLMFIVVGAVLMYYILHAHGWNLSGGAPLGGVFRTLPVSSRALVVAGLIITAWGTGALLSGLARPRV
jgi:hypothetical protein